MFVLQVAADNRSAAGAGSPSAALIRWPQPELLDQEPQSASTD